MPRKAQPAPTSPATPPKKRSRAPRKKAAALYANDLAYLQDELRWIEARARRLAAEARLRAPERSFGRSRRPFEQDPDLDGILGLPSRAEDLAATEQRLRAEIDGRLKAHATSGQPLALDRLCATFGLDSFERTVLLLAAAPCFSTRFEELYGAMGGEDMTDCLTVQHAFCFVEASFVERIERRAAFGPRSRLVSNDLLTLQIVGRYQSPKDLLQADLELSQRTFSQLLGRMELENELMEFSSVEEPRATFDQVVLDDADRTRLLSVAENHERYLACRREWGFDSIIRYGRGALMLFHGKPGTGKTMTAHAIAHRLGKRVLTVDVPTFAESREADRFLPRLFREARVQDALLFFDECEVLFGDRRHGNLLMTLLLTELERFEGVAVLATNLPDLLDEALDRRILVRVHFPEPDREARLEIWRKHIPPEAPVADDVDLEALATRFELSGGYIKNAVLAAVAYAVHSAGTGASISHAHLEQAARDQAGRPRSDDNPLVVPKVRLADVVLAPETEAALRELVDATRNLSTLLGRWGIGSHLSYGRGLSALLHGPPGTGKTLCAEALAGELCRPLLTASLPAVVSKWVGESEANLERLFRDAKRERAVLFLDEADSLLGERGGGEGGAARHDDRLVNVLLRLIERHEGVVLLATNLPGALDAALHRRMTYCLYLGEPNAAQRSAIWRRLIPETVPGRAGLDFDRLGRRWSLVGGRIKNAVFKAALRAARQGGVLTQALAEQAAQEELDAAGTGQTAAIGFARVG